MSIANLKDGRVLNGIIAAKTDRTLTLKTMTETVIIERVEIESLPGVRSVADAGRFTGSVERNQVRDLIAYLMHTAQVPLPAISAAR